MLTVQILHHLNDQYETKNTQKINVHVANVKHFFRGINFFLF